MTEQTTIIPESTGQKIVRCFKKEAKSRKVIIAMVLLAICIVAGYSVGYNEGYHTALIDFKIITGSVFTL
jgi:hypothetical protein